MTDNETSLHAVLAELDRLREQNERLQQRVERLEGGGETPTVGRPAAPLATGTPEAVPIDRRRLLSRAGTAAVGAVIGGAVASVAAAAPAAAASASFDSTTQDTPALTASNTGGGMAISATSEGTGNSLPTVWVRTTSGIAIDAGSKNDTGVKASGDVVGVWGYGQGWGVYGQSLNGAGVVAYSRNGIGATAAGGTANLLLRSPFGEEPVPPPGQNVAHQKGEVVFDKNADLWLCTAGGTPGTWVKLNPPAVVAGTFVVLPAPVRVYDSRPGNPPTAVGPKTPLGTRTPRSGIAATANSSGVPTDATAAMVSATVTRTTGGSSAEPAFLSLYASGQWPGTSNLNWTTSGATIAVTTVVPLAPGGTLTAYASNPTDLILDVVGYYR